MIKPVARGLQLVSATARLSHSILILESIVDNETSIADEYRKSIGKDAALEQHFQPVQIEEPIVESMISILRGLKSRYHVHHRWRSRTARSSLVSLHSTK